MSNWTPEAREYLEGYLTQIRALARNAGEDAEDIVAGLREHIELEAATTPGAIVTLDHLRGALASVGTPEQVTSADSLLSRPRVGAIPPGETRGPAAAPAPTPPPPHSLMAVNPPQRRRVGCWFAVALCLLAIVVILALSALVSLQSRAMTQGSIYAHQKAAVATLQAILSSEERAVLKPENDLDGDKLPDYVPLQQLADKELLSAAYNDVSSSGYHFSLQLTPSASNNGKPAFLCTALPIIKEFGDAYTIDQTGEVRSVSAQSDDASLFSNPVQ